ncbi:hypothetical protein D3C80_1935580 [compost metagenome]
MAQLPRVILYCTAVPAGKLNVIEYTPSLPLVNWYAGSAAFQLLKVPVKYTGPLAGVMPGTLTLKVTLSACGSPAAMLPFTRLHVPAPK